MCFFFFLFFFIYFFTLDSGSQFYHACDVTSKSSCLFSTPHLLCFHGKKLLIFFNLCFDVYFWRQISNRLSSSPSIGPTKQSLRYHIGTIGKQPRTHWAGTIASAKDASRSFGKNLCHALGLRLKVILNFAEILVLDLGINRSVSGPEKFKKKSRSKNFFVKLIYLISRVFLAWTF